MAVLGLACAVRAQEATTSSNLDFRLSQGDLGTFSVPIVTVPGESRRAVRVSEGGEQLLALCQARADLFQNDSLLFRFGHRNPGSTIGCRERSSPSMHMVFYEQNDGSREAWVHFDLHGPQNLAGHTTEVLRNRMSWGHTSEHEVFRGLARQAGGPIPPPKYDTKKHARQYVRDVFSLKAVSSAVAGASAATTFRLITNGDMGERSYLQRVTSNLVRNGVTKSIEFGAGAFLQQDLTFRASGKEGMGRRSKSALYRAFFVPGRQHDEFAFPRFASALGTPWVMRSMGSQRNPWLQSAWMLGRYVLRSYWAEFKPDVTTRMRRMFRRD